MNDKTISQLLDDIWGDVRRDQGKANYAVRKLKTLQKMRWIIGDILTEFQKDRKKGLMLAKHFLQEE